MVGAAAARKRIRILDGARDDQSVVYDSSRLRRCQVPIAAVEGALRAAGAPSVAGEGEEIAASTRGKFRDNLSVVWAWRDGRGMRCLVAGHPWCLCDGHGAHRRAVSEMVGPGPHVGRTIPMLSPGAHRRPGGAMGAQVEKGRRSGRAAPLIGSPVLRKATGSPSGCATAPRGLQKRRRVAQSESPAQSESAAERCRSEPRGGFPVQPSAAARNILFSTRRQAPCRR